MAATRRARPPAHLVALVLCIGAATCTLPACASLWNRPDPAAHYRLARSGSHWDIVGNDHVLDDLLPRYPAYFAVLLEPSRSDEPDVRKLRRDLEYQPADRRNYDALNAIAIGYFELNYRGETARETGNMRFLTTGMRAAKLAAVPWRAYGNVSEGALRSAILDFFEDVSTGEKLGSARTRSRLSPVVSSLARKEHDPKRLARIKALSERLAADQAPHG